MPLFRRLRKELGRWRAKLAGVPWLLRGAAARRGYDQTRGARVRVTEGAQALTEEVAILVIFPVEGVLPSTLSLLDYLARNGVATLVVSNAPLKPSDRDHLREIAHLVIERPNVSFDFGGYREGILTLFERGIAPRALYIANDSIWLPLRADCDVIARCRAAGEDIFGLYLNATSRFGQHREYVQSYFLRFSQRLVASPAFLRFWREMPMADDKHLLVRRCERGLSWHFVRRGFSIGAIIHWRDVVDRLLGLQDEAMMRRFMEYQCAISPKDAAHMLPLLEKGLPALAIRDRLAPSIRRKRLFSAFPLMHPEFVLAVGLPFLKRKMRPQHIELTRLGLAETLVPAVQAEMARPWPSECPPQAGVVASPLPGGAVLTSQT